MNHLIGVRITYTFAVKRTLNYLNLISTKFIINSNIVVDLIVMLSYFSM